MYGYRIQLTYGNSAVCRKKYFRYPFAAKWFDKSSRQQFLNWYRLFRQVTRFAWNVIAFTRLKSAVCQQENWLNPLPALSQRPFALCGAEKKTRRTPKWTADPILT
ncbi:hypothetical protein KM043_015677 [Ampulex compressa]|nr:hypothetical protein KM043_015677 [Ampulex compressa]